MFRRKKQLEPAFDIAALRSELQNLLERAKSAGLRHYQIAPVLEQAAQAINLKHEMTTASGPGSLTVEQVEAFLNRNTR